MNPFPAYQFTQPRDKTKSYFQPPSHNPFSVSQLHSQSSVSSNHTSSTNQSDKYKSYYTEHQDFRMGNNGFFHVPNNNPVLQRDRSLQRNRFYTVAEHQRKIFMNDHPLGNVQQQNFSQSMIAMTNRPTSITKEQTISKKDAYTFAGSKFASSKVQSQYNSRQKKPESHSHNKSQYLQKANKKVSLKRDIAPISPKSQQTITNTHNTPRYPPSQPSFVNISNKFNINQNTANSKAQQTNHTEMERNTQRTQVDDMIMPSTLERFSSASDNSEVSGGQRNTEIQAKQLSFKKHSNKGGVSMYQAQRAVSAYDAERTTPSSHSSAVATNQYASQISSNTNEQSSINQNTGKAINSKPFFGSIRSNSSTQRQVSTQHLIDSQVLTDMKISRIEQSTSNLQQKVLTLTKTLQQVVHQSKQHQCSINEINSYMTRQQEEGLTPHDIKRIKKELKIMKTNFETAFTSMTDQINRKLIKQENIMKSLSEQIKVVAEQNFKLNQTVERRSRKVESLQKSMTSFMRQNEQRMESLVLNESFSSSKRSKNHSFEYGLDLKNMSSDDNYSSGKSYGAEGGSGKRLEGIEREISKMKVFHIKQQQTYQGRFAELKTQIQKAAYDQSKYIMRTDCQHMIRQAVDQILSLKHQTWQAIQTQHYQQKHHRTEQQIHALKVKLEELNKICHEELYDFRMSKLQQVPPLKFVTQSKIKTMNGELELQLGDVQSQQRNLLGMMSDFQHKFSGFEEKQHQLIKNLDELKLKELKHTGDLRDIQSSLKQAHHTLTSLKPLKQTIPDLHRLSNTQNTLITNIESRAVNIESRINEVDRINNIQTENIESINNEFERVINKEIIPKIQETHHASIQVNHKIYALNTDLANIKRFVDMQGASFGENSLINLGKRTFTDQKQLEMKIQQQITLQMPKFITSKVKLISTKFLSSKSPLSKIGLFKDKKLPSEHLDINSFRKNTQNHIQDLQSQIAKEQTYLVDEDGYLMDWEGAYLMEVDEFGSRKKIQVSEDELYFMEVNGIEVKKPQGTF